MTLCIPVTCQELPLRLTSNNEFFSVSSDLFGLTLSQNNENEQAISVGYQKTMLHKIV